MIFFKWTLPIQAKTTIMWRRTLEHAAVDPKSHDIIHLSKWNEHPYINICLNNFLKYLQSYTPYLDNKSVNRLIESYSFKRVFWVSHLNRYQFSCRSGLNEIYWNSNSNYRDVTQAIRTLLTEIYKVFITKVFGLWTHYFWGVFSPIWEILIFSYSQ